MQNKSSMSICSLDSEYLHWPSLWDIPASIRFVNVSFMVVSVTSNSLYWGC